MVHIFYSAEFARQIKHLAKKYKSLADDLLVLNDELLSNPMLGIDLGNGIRKIRMSIKSKARGKSGGARVISLTAIISQNDTNVTLLTIYDKSEKDTISDKEIKSLIQKIK